MSPLNIHHYLAGLLIGTAVGDALGLPAEGLSRERIDRKWKGVWKHRFLFGHGMCSDDTEHTLFVAQALLAHGDGVERFQKCLAWKLQLWLLGLPAGVGFATLRAIIKLWLGFSPAHSGVFSAGNGPAMRSAVIGAYFSDQPEQRRNFVSASTRLTHVDPKAETAAMAVAEAAAWAVNQGQHVEQWITELQNITNDEEWRVILQRFADFYAAGKSVQDFADSLGSANGVSGYSYHSVPVALYAFVRYSYDFRFAVVAALNCGGDTDTIGAITGALCGARNGMDNIPNRWRSRLCDWPRSSGLFLKAAHRLAAQKASGHPLGPIHYFWPALILRNAIFMITVLIHGMLRILS